MSLTGIYPDRVRYIEGTRRPSITHPCALARFNSARAHSSTSEGGPHVLGQPQRLGAVRNSYHHHALGAGDGVLAKAREIKWDQHEDRNSENLFSAAAVTQSQISFSKGYLICLVGSVWWYRTIIKHSGSNSSPKYTYIHTSPLLDFSSLLLLMVSFHSLIHDVILSSRGPVLWSHRSLIHTRTHILALEYCPLDSIAGPRGLTIVVSSSGGLGLGEVARAGLEVHPVGGDGLVEGLPGL